MQTDLTPQTAYHQQSQRYQAMLSQLQQKRRQIGWLRLSVFLLMIALAYFGFTQYGLFGLVPTVLGLGGLLYLVSLDVANSEKIRNAKTLIRVNEEELQVLNHQFGDRENGHVFMPADHAYANDLDIVGEASVYQWLSRCYTEQGRQHLATDLLHGKPLEQILERQEAVKELASKLEWRQQWQAYAMRKTITHKTETKITNWLQQDEDHFLHPAWKPGVRIYSCVTIATAVAAILDYIPGAVFSLLFLIYLIVSLVLSRHAILAYMQLNGIVKEASTLQVLIDWFESAKFESPFITSMQDGLKADQQSASEEIKTLKKILDRFDLRTSIISFIFLQPFLLWDVRQMIALNAWRKRNKSYASRWFAVIAELEVVHSIASLHFNHGHWCFPSFATSHFSLKGEGIGHPLLPEAQRITNNFSLQGLAKVGLITGSNMAGKSTFLRSLGVNTVLAQIGAPVCAKRFLLSPVEVVSSMRIADNLAENTSTFYAELKKLRTIIDMVKAHRPVFILLDEILRGTNSFDRHKGAAALIQQLIHENAVAVIATHDVELAQMESSFPQSIANYHFDVTIEGEELYFDYKLKPGVCQSLNASLLMKKIGIDFSE